MVPKSIELPRVHSVMIIMIIIIMMVKKVFFENERCFLRNLGNLKKYWHHLGYLATWSIWGVGSPCKLSFTRHGMKDSFQIIDYKYPSKNPEGQPDQYFFRFMFMTHFQVKYSSLLPLLRYLVNMVLAWISLYWSDLEHQNCDTEVCKAPKK